MKGVSHDTFAILRHSLFLGEGTMGRKKIRQILLRSIFYLAVFFIFIMPLLGLLRMSVTLESGGYGLDSYIRLLHEGRTLKAIKNTLLVSIGSTVISMLLGGFFAFLIAYTDIRRKKIMELLVLAPFVIPSYIITLSWSNFLVKKGMVNTLLGAVGIPAIDIYTLPGIIFVMGICNTPIVYLITVNMLRKVPRDLEWASRASGYGLWHTMLKINLAQVMPALAGGGMLAFLSSIDNFAIPAFLGISSGIPVLSTYIYEKAISFGPDSFHLAAALSVILSVIAIAGNVVQTKFIKKGANLESIKEDYSVRIKMKGRTRRFTEWGCLIFLTAINIVPIISMMASSFLKTYGAKFKIENLSLENFEFVFTNRGVMQSIRNSITFALTACAVCILAGTAIAYMKVRKKSKAVTMLEAGASLTYAVPGIVLSLSMIFHWTMLPNIYGTVKILIIAYITRYLILQIKGSVTAMLSVDPTLEEAAMASGSGRFRTWRKVLLPLLTRQVLSGAFVIFVSAMTEVTLSSMLAAAGTRTIGLTIFNLQQSGDYNLSSAMSSVIVAIVLMGYALSFVFRRRKAGGIRAKGRESSLNFKEEAVYYNG